jgi:hypothetical protein
MAQCHAIFHLYLSLTFIAFHIAFLLSLVGVLSLAFNERLPPPIIGDKRR